jgi:nuclear transport factor 2 (NTF2) superfamily protein
VKVRLAEDAWNSRDPERVSLAYTEDSQWRNRSELFARRSAIVAFLTRKWARELDYRLVKSSGRFRTTASKPRPGDFIGRRHTRRTMSAGQLTFSSTRS